MYTKSHVQATIRTLNQAYLPGDMSFLKITRYLSDRRENVLVKIVNTIL